MAVSATVNRVQYSGNGSSTVFSFPYYFLAQSDLVVIETVVATGVETVKTLTTHYTVSGAGTASGGSVTMLVAPATGVTLTIYDDPALTQGLNLIENDPLPAEATEQGFDRLTLIAQRNRELIGSKMGLSAGFVGSFSLNLPAALAQSTSANKALIVNSSYNAFDLGPTTTQISEAGSNAVAAAASAVSAAASAASASLDASSALFRWAGTAGGSPNNLTLTPSPAITSYSAGQRFAFVTSSTNTSGTMTVSVSGVGSQSIFDRHGNLVTVGMVRNGELYNLTYNGSHFRIDAPIPTATADNQVLTSSSASSLGYEFRSKNMAVYVAPSAPVYPTGSELIIDYGNVVTADSVNTVTVGSSWVYTAARPGFRWVSAAVGFSSSGANGTWEMRMYHNGVRVANTFGTAYSTGGFVDTAFVTTGISMAAGDTLQFRFRNDYGSALTLTAGSSTNRVAIYEL